MRAVSSLRKILNQRGAIAVPGVYDALSAKIADSLDFRVIFHTGYGTAASLLGLPDIGLVSFKEMVDRVESICKATKKPVIADADTGYGNAINTMRTVQQYVHAGVAGLILEDQVWPKKCGHMGGKDVIPVDEMVGKIRAAVDARDEEGSDVVIIGRTDSFATGGLGEAIERVRLFEKAGADVLFIEAPLEINDLKEIPKSVKLPLLLNQIEGGRTPIIPFREAERLGFKIILFPLSSIFAATRGMIDILDYMKRENTTTGLEEKMMTFDEFNKLVEVERFSDLETRYASSAINRRYKKSHDKDVSRR